MITTSSITLSASCITLHRATEKLSVSLTDLIGLKHHLLQQIKRLLSNSSHTSICVLLEGLGIELMLPVLIAQVQLFLQPAQRLHLMLAQAHPLRADDWRRLIYIYPNSEHEALLWLEQHWPLPMPSMQRLDRDDRRVSLTINFGNPDLIQKQWVAAVDVFVRLGVCQPLLIEPQQDRPYIQSSYMPLFLRKAAVNSHIISNLDSIDDIEQVCRRTGLKIVRLWQTKPTACSQSHTQSDLQGCSTETLVNPLRSRSSSAPIAGAPKRTWYTVSTHALRPDRYSFKTAHNKMAIVGGGIAGAGIAHSMSQRGWDVTVFDPALHDSPAGLQQGHLAAAMTPYISADDNFKARLSRAGVLRAHARWQHFPDDVIVSRAGTLEVNRDKGYAKDILQAVEQLGLPEQWVRIVNASEASALSGLHFEQHAVFWPYAWQISPQNLIQYLLANSAICKKTIGVSRIVRASTDSYSENKSSVWHLLDTHGRNIGEFGQVVLAASVLTLNIVRNSGLLERSTNSEKCVNCMPKISKSLHWLGGEVMHVPKNILTEVPACGIGGQGYFLPSVNDYCVLGGTYQHNIAKPIPSIEAQHLIVQKMPFELALSTQKLYPGWSGARAVVQDRLPVITNLPHADGVWLALAYGSHGLTWSCLAGELIGALLDGEPLPLEKDLWLAIGLR